MLRFLIPTIAVFGLIVSFLTPLAVDAGDAHESVETEEFVVEFDDSKVEGWQTTTKVSISVEQGSYRENNETKHEPMLLRQPIFADFTTRPIRFLSGQLEIR